MSDDIFAEDRKRIKNDDLRKIYSIFREESLA